MDKKLIKNIIIDNYSIMDISNEIKNINNIINDLLDCSNNDFKFLNEKFKDYYKTTKFISDSTQKLYNVINDKLQNSEIENEIDDYLLKLKNYDNIFKNVINTLIISTEEINKNLELSNSSKINLNENIKTFKLIFENINYKNIFKEKEKEIKEEIPKLFEIIKENIFSYNNNYKYLFETINNIKNRLNNIKEIHIKKINIILNDIEKIKELLSKKRQKATKKYPDLYNLIVDITKNKDNIIKNLQYHDIIRQRIEHIQKAFNSVNDILNENKKLSNEEFTNTIIQTKDISKIQISQLNNTSKDYQTSIEEISESLLSLSENSINIFEMYQELNDNSKNYNHFKEMKEKLKSTIKVKSKLIKNNIEIESFYSKISIIISDYINSYNNMNEEIQKIFFIKKFIEGNDSKLTKLHLKLVLNDLEQSLIDIKKYNLNIKNNIKETKEKICKLITDETIEKELRKLNENGYELLSKIKNNQEKLNNILINNEKYCSNLSDKILKDIKNIHYYDNYHKNINKIKKIYKDNFSIIDSEVNLKNLHNIESEYTMDSERNIHHNKENNKDIGNNIELF